MRVQGVSGPLPAAGGRPAGCPEGHSRAPVQPRQLCPEPGSPIPGPPLPQRRQQCPQKGRHGSLCRCVPVPVCIQCLPFLLPWLPSQLCAGLNSSPRTFQAACGPLQAHDGCYGQPQHFQDLQSHHCWGGRSSWVQTGKTQASSQGGRVLSSPALGILESLICQCRIAKVSSGTGRPMQCPSLLLLHVSEPAEPCMNTIPMLKQRLHPCVCKHGAHEATPLSPNAASV